jgi:hypothetical protein
LEPEKIAFDVPGELGIVVLSDRSSGVYRGRSRLSWIASSALNLAADAAYLFAAGDIGRRSIRIEKFDP